MSENEILALADLMLEGCDPDADLGDYSSRDYAEMLISDADEWDEDLIDDESHELLIAIKADHDTMNLNILIDALVSKIESMINK